MARSTLKNICRLIEQTSIEVPVEQSFLADLKYSIETTDNKTKRKPSQTYKPSSMKCIRNMYYQRIGADVDDTSSSYSAIGICSSGSSTHIYIQQAVECMKDNGIDCEYIDVSEYVKSHNLDYLQVVLKSGMETKLFHKDWCMSFMCDGIIRYKKRYYILELKTEASFKWTSRTGVDESHYMQGIAYSLALQLPEVLFVYINRDIMDMKSYMFVPTADMKSLFISRIQDCEGYVSRQIPPPKPDDVLRKTCEYCSYRQQCRKD